MFVSRHHVSMRVEKKLGTDEGVMLLVSKKSINKPHSLFKPQGSKLGKKVAAYSPEITVNMPCTRTLSVLPCVVKWL